MHIGLAGWGNPPSHRSLRSGNETHLQYYAGHFSCVEINSSFYRSHRFSTYARWNVQTPRAFRFAVKMPRVITHESGLRHTCGEMTQFFRGIESLQPKLAVVLIQFPPRLEFKRRLVAAFFRSVPRLPTVKLVCEPRHVSWFGGEVEEQLAEWNVSRVAADPARTPNASVPGGDGTFVYCRWHGSPQIYYSSYSAEQLKGFATAAGLRGPTPTWCIFDNTARYAAWENALDFASLQS